MADLIPWGFGGLQAAQQLQMNQQLMRGREVGIQQAQAQLDQTEKDNELNQQAAALFQNIAKGDSTNTTLGSSSPEQIDPVEAFNKVGNAMLSVGAPKKANEFFNSAATLMKVKDVNTTALLNQQKAKADLLGQQADFMARDLGGATNQEEWNQGLATMQQQADAGLFPQAVVDQYKQIPFSPEVAAHIKNSALSTKDKANLDMQAQRVAAEQDRAASLDAYRSARLKQEQQKVDAANAEREKKEKAGVIAPTPNQIKEAEGVVSSLIFDNQAPQQYASADDKKVGKTTQSYQAYMAGVTAIANDANQMLKENRGLTRIEALNRAALASKNNGDWDIQTTNPSGLSRFFGSKPETSTNFSTAGKQPEEALDAPVKDGKLDASGMKPNHWYTHDGKTFRYNADGTVSVMQ